MADWKESAKKSLENRNSNITTPVVSTPKKPTVTKAPTTGTTGSGSWKEQLQKSLDSRGYIPPEKRSYELKLNDGNNFGVVSYEAYKAITNNQIEGYTPKSESEKQAIESYKEWTKQNFSKNSTYKSTKNGKKKHRIPGTSYYDETGYDDIEHDYINGDEEAIGIVNANEATSSKFILGTDSQFLKTMTPDEKAIYNYIYNTNGKDAAKKYIKDISSDLNLRQRLKSEKELAKYAKENKWTMSAATVVLAPMKVVSAVGQINDYLDDGKIDQNAGYNKYVYNTNAVRGSVSEEIEKGATGKLGSFLYNTGMSIGDSTMNTIASGGNKFLSLGTMGIGAFANSVVSAKDRGLSDNQAMGLGVVSAIAEIFTESFSWDKLFGAKNIGEGLFNGAEKGVKSYILDNIKTNALEEMGADAINFAADVFISKDKSEWQDSVNKYIKDGYSESKAWALTFKDTATQFALSGLAGALSGATMSGSTGIMINSHIKSVGEANSNNVLGIIGDGLSYDKNSEAYKHALKLSKSNGEITDYDIGRQVLLNDVQKINTTIGEGLKQDKNSEAYKNAKRLQKSDNVTSEDLEYQNLLNKGEKIINVGESFADSKYNISIKVVGQNKGNTTIETTNLSTGKTETKSLPSSMVNSMLLSDRYTKLETPSTTEVVEETANAESETTPQESITSEQLIETANVTTEENSTVENTEVESAAETTEAPSQKDINLKRVGKFYEVYGEEAKLLATELDLETTKAVINGVETDVLRLPADLTEKLANAIGDEYNLVLSDKPKAKNQSLTNETTTTDETTPSVEENATEDEISVVADAMNDTFKPGAKEALENSDLKGDVVQFAELVIKFYKEYKTLSSFADYFTDKGAKVISAIEGKTDTVENTSKIETDNKNDVVDIISETLTPQAKETLQDGDVNGNYVSMAETLIEVYKENGTIEDFADFFTDGGKKVEAVIKGETVETQSETLKNESESDTMESSTEKTSVEREDNSNERGSNTLSGNSRRGYNGSTRKQAERISYFERENQGRDATERQNFTRELVERGQVEEVTEGNYKYVVIKPEAYNDDILSMVEEAKKKGVELQFIVGKVRVDYDTADEFTVRGLKLSGTKVVVQYDNVKSPQKIAKHEIIHAKWNTPEIQAIKDAIINSLSVEDKQSILSQERYSRYNEMYKGDENAVLEEFVCDVMSGDTYYYADYIDTVIDYWSGNETVEGYNAADYSTSKDAGGKDATEGRYDLSDEGSEHDEKRNNSRGISGISKEFGNKRRRNTDSERGSLRSIRQVSISENSEKQTELHRATPGNTARSSGASLDDHSIGSLAMGRKGEDGSSSNNRRFAEALKNNDESFARDLLDEQATKNGYVPVTRYRGEKSETVKTSFEDKDIVWVSKSFDYAKEYAQNGEFTDAKMSEQLHTSKHSNIYDLYAKYGKILELGDIEQTIDDIDDLNNFANRIGFTVDELIDCMDNYREHGVKEIFAITYTKKFADLAREKGYDSLHTLEGGGKFEAYGILYPENVKSAKLKTYDDKGKLIPLSKRFDNTTVDIRYDLDEDSDGNALTEEQQEYFKDSKVRDENGVLKVVYHGTRKADFTEFKRNINFFTDSEEMADSYSPNGEMYKGYLNITKPYEIDAAGEKWSKVPVDEATKQFLQEYGASVFKEGGKWRTTPADIAAAIEEAVDNGELDYDGIIIKNIDDTGSYYKGKGKHLGTDYIAFNSNQFKNADNTTPTSNPDIRYDIDDADNEYMKAVENGDVETASKLIEEAAEKAFSNSKVRGSDGKLKLVYHGRVSDFNVFDRSFANVEGDFGKGYYFTSNEYDVDANYANEEGPDLKNKISRLAERLEREDEYSDLSYEEREEIARQRFVTSEPNTITAYLNMENPVYITPDEKGTFLDYTEEYDEENDEYGEPEGLLLDFIEALKNNSYDYAYNDVDFSFLYEYAYDGGMYASDAVKIIKERILDELSDEEGNIATNEVIRLAFEEIGFDGIIDTSVYYKFNNMSGMDSGTTHYIVFDSEQIKSADIATYDDKGNVIPLSERFNENNKDIRYDIDDLDDGYEKARNMQIEINQLDKKLGEIEDSTEYGEAMDIFMKSVENGESNKAIAEYNKTLEELGYTEAQKRKGALQEELNKLRTSLRAKEERDRLDAENKAIEKSGLSEADYFRKQAVKEFGYTPYFYDAGYITPNGKMLNFSGEKGMHYGVRGEDHRAIGRVYANVSGSKAMIKFMGEGNIRIISESPGIDISSSVEPSKEQYATIKKFVREYANKEYFNIDITDAEGHTIGNYEYEGGVSAERVVNDIKYYFENGTTREASSIAQFRYDIDSESKLETQKKIENMAKEITSHEEFISLTKQNTQEFVDKIKENKSLQKRLHNAKRQMLLSPKPIVNIVKVGQVTKDILKEMDSTLKATDLKDRVTSIYNEYFADVKKAAGVESKTQEANDNMMKKFAELAVDIADSSVAYTESEEYGLLKSYVRNTRIRIPESAKSDAHYAEFRKSHMGTFNLTNDGLEMDVAYQELCEMFPGMLDESITHPADQLYAIVEKLESLKPYAYNPHTEYMQDAIDHIVYRFVSEADGIAAMPKTKAQKIAEKGAYDKEMALEKERASFERKLDKHKKNSENIINKLQKKIGDSEYVRYWEKRLSKEEKTQAVNKVRERQKVAILKTKIRNIVSNMKKKLDKSEKTGGYPKELVKTVAEVCSALDFHTDRTGKDGGPTKASLKLDALKMQYDALKDNENYDFASEFDEGLSSEIQKLHNKVKDKRVVDLTATELSELKDILSEISHRLSKATKQIGLEKAKENAAIGSEIIGSLNTRSDVIKSEQKQLLKEIKLVGQQGKSLVLNPHRINKMIAGYDENSAWWELYDGINRGSRKASKFVMEANKPFDELVDGGGNEIAFYDFRTKNIKTGIKYLDGTEVEIPKSIICELVMMWDRKQGRTHLESGGAKIPNMKLYNKGKTTTAITDAGKRTAPITQADIDRLKTKLDSYDKAWIEKAHHLFNNVSKNAINETSMELIGRELAKEENYIRMYVDQDFIRREIDGKKDDATLESHGSLKETVPNAKQPVVLRGLHENVYDNIDFSSKYYGLAIPIRNFNKVYNIVIGDGKTRNSVKELIGQKYGSAIRSNVVEQLIRDLQAPRPRNIEPFGKIRGKWLGATFWGNIRSAFKQTTSYWTASSILSESSLIKGVAEYGRHTKQTKAEIGKYSGTLYKRSQGLSTTELGDRANRKRLAGASNKATKLINEYAPVLRKIPEWIRPGNWLQSMDCAVSSALWEACKFEVSKTMNASDDGYMKAVTDLYEKVIEETQSNYDVAHRPEALKNTNAVMSTITMFQTDNLQQSGIMFDAFNNYKTKSDLYKKDNSSANEKALNEAKKGFSKAIRSRVYSSLWLMLVTHVGNMLLRKFKPYIDEEEKEITSSSVAKQSMLMLCDDMLGVFVPVVGPLISKVADTFSDGYDFVTEPTFDVMEDFIKSTSKIWDAFTNDEKGDVLKAFTDAIPSISNMTGIPAKNISDMFNAIKGYAGDIIEGDFAHDITDYTSGNKSFYSYGDLASSISSGDNEKETKILDYYSANGKEVSRGSLTEEIKPAYVQMYIDSPEKARGIAIKLVKDYKYSADTINNWCYDEYLDNIVSNPEYAEEIKSAFRSGSAWKNEAFLKAAKSYYKSVYKEGNENDIDDLKNALINGAKIANSTLTQWEKEVDKKIKESERERQKDLNNLQ